VTKVKGAELEEGLTARGREELLGGPRNALLFGGVDARCLQTRTGFAMRLCTCI
jgi:hypothetical protein